MKTMQDTKEKYNKDTEIKTLKKKSNWNPGNEILVTQTKTSVESLTNGVKQGGNRLSGIEDKGEELDQTRKY
jgi:hypothetical protein